MRNFICVLIIIVLGILMASAHSKLKYPEECREEAEMCQDNPIVHDIETSDDYWKAGFQPSSIFSPDSDDDNGLDSFPSYKTPSWLTTTSVMDNLCYYRDKDNTSYICQSPDLQDFDEIFIPQNLKYLKINGTGITNIPNDVFLNHTITALIINNNEKIGKISRKSFRGIKGLAYLYINGNEMIKWPKIEDSFFYLFDEATELRHLVLESNNITFKGK